MSQIAEKINLKTALNAFHVSHGGKMVPFAGYDMPLQYTDGIVKEHQYVRSAAGIFDVSHMGQFSIYGNEDDYKILEKIIPIDLSSLNLNQSKYTVLMNSNGGVDDDLIVTKVNHGLNIVLNAACKHHDVERINEVIDPKKTKLHENLSLIAIQGPKAVEIVESLIPGVSSLKFMNGDSFKLNNEEVYVTRSGYTGEDGFEVSISNKVVENFCKQLIEKGAKLIGLGARDSLRLEAGLCLYGHDLDTKTTPIESSLAWALSKKNKEEGSFIGASILQDQIKNGVNKKRVGIRPEKIIAREGSKIFKDGKEIGIVTSGGFGPSVNHPIAMGYIQNEFSSDDTEIELEVRGKKHPAKVAKLPFYKKSYVK
jgi:aminomethyltransferase